MKASYMCVGEENTFSVWRNLSYYFSAAAASGKVDLQTHRITQYIHDVNELCVLG